MAKKQSGKGETAHSQDSVPAAGPGPAEIGGFEKPQFARCSTRVVDQQDGADA
jgi:hypothetical protein